VQYCVFEHTLPPNSPYRDAVERDAPFPEHLYPSIEVPSKPSPPPCSPMGAPMERDAHFQNLPLHIQGPSKGSPTSGSPHRASIEGGRGREGEMLHFLSPPSVFQESLVNEPLSRFPHRREMSIFIAFFHIFPGVPNRQSLLMKQNLTFLSKFPVKYLLLHGHPMEPLWREMLHCQSHWFID